MEHQVLDLPDPFLAVRRLRFQKDIRFLFIHPECGLHDLFSCKPPELT